MAGLMERSSRGTTLICGLAAFQAITFYSFYQFEIAPFPPEAFDQSVFLSKVYGLVAAYNAHGLWNVLKVPFAGDPQSALFTFAGASMEIMFHQGRFAPLLLNFGALITLEAVLYSTLCNLTGRKPLAMAALGLLLAAHTSWFWAGGIFDFRMDWIASCLFGIWLCIVLRSRVFSNLRLSAVSGGIAALVVLTRYVTVVYIFGVEIVLVALFAIAHIWLDQRERLRNCLVAIGLASALFLPFIVGSLKSIHDYYVVGHITGPEKRIRAAEIGASSLWDHLLYYPLSIVKDHLGLNFGLVLLLYVLGIGAWVIAEHARLGDWRDRIPDPAHSIWQVLVLIGSVVGPIVVLTSDLAKSPVVGGIVVVPVIIFVVLLPWWVGLAGSRQPALAPSALIRAIPNLIGASCLAAGLIVSLGANAARRSSLLRHDFYDWRRLIIDVNDDAHDRRLASPKIFFNYMTSHFNRAAFTAFGFEATGQFTPFDPVLRDAIFAPDPAWVMAQLPTSDYVVLSTATKVGVYPVYPVMTALDPEIRRWTESHFKLLKSYAFDAGTVDLFVRP